MPKNTNGATGAARKATTKPGSGAAVAREQREEAIRLRAYELYLSRQDQGDGTEMDDWLQAEREVGATTPAATRRRAPARRKS